MKSLRPSLVTAVVLFAATSVSAHAQTVVERSMETRFQLDLKVADAALKPFLPQGWTSNVATQGPAKDCNLRLIFTDRETINDADGKPVGKGSNVTAALIAPVKDASGNVVQLVIGGITGDPSDAPGPFGNYLAASKLDVHRTTSTGLAGPDVESQDWLFEAKSGEHLELHIKFEKGTGNRGNPADVKFYSAKDPAVFQLSHQEQVLDILRNTTTNPKDRVKEFTLKASGGSYASFLDGSQKVLSWDHLIWVGRSILKP